MINKIIENEVIICFNNDVIAPAGVGKICDQIKESWQSAIVSNIRGDSLCILDNGILSFKDNSYVVEWQWIELLCDWDIENTISIYKYCITSVLINRVEQFKLDQ